MKTDTDIEQLFMDGKKHSLPTHEKESIKLALLDHASKTLSYEVLAVPSPWMSWMFRGSMSFAALLMVFIGTAYVSQGSLPGEPLYVMKVHVVEEMIAFTKTTPLERVAYDIQLMEYRLEEIKEMVSQDAATTPEDIVTLTDQIDEHVTDVNTILESATSDYLSHEEKMEVLAKLSGVTKAQTKVAREVPEFTVAAETITETQESTTDAMVTAIEAFVEDESALVVHEYLSDQITDVGEYVHASSTDASARDAAERHLYDVEEALIDGDTAEAIVSIFEAQQEIDSEEYLDGDLIIEAEITH